MTAQRIDYVPVRDLRIRRVRLLTKSEYEAYKNILPPVGDNWLLGTPVQDAGKYHYPLVYHAGKGGGVGPNELFMAYAGAIGEVHPVLEVDTTGTELVNRQRFLWGGYIFVVFGGNRLFCVDSIGEMPFDNNGSNNWETSSLRLLLESVFEDFNKEDEDL